MGKDGSLLNLSSILDGTPSLEIEEDEDDSKTKKTDDDANLQSKNAADTAAKVKAKAEAEAEAAGDEGDEDEDDDEKGGKAKSKEDGVSKGSKSGEDDEVDEVDEDDDSKKGDEDGDDKEVAVFEALKEKTGYEIEGNFEETVEGIVEYTDKLADAKAKDIVESTFEQYPVAKTFIEYLKNGGDPANFFEVQHPQVDYTSIQLGKGEEGAAAQKEMLSHFYATKGIDNAKITQLLAMAEETGTLEKDAFSGLSELADVQKKSKAEQLKSQALKEETDRQDAESYWKEIQTVVNKGKIGSFELPQRSRSEFYNWLTVPVNKKGQTQREVAFEGLTDDENLQLEYIVHKKFNLFSAFKAPKGKTKTDDAVSKMLEKTRKKQSTTVEEPETTPATSKVIDLSTLLKS